MTVLSPQFRVAEYFSVQVSESGKLGAPFPAEASQLRLESLAGKFLYVFAEATSGPEPWVLLCIYKAEAATNVSTLFVQLRSVLGSDSDGELVLGDPNGFLRLPTALSGGLTGRKYFFLAVPRLLDPSVERKLARKRPPFLPAVQLDGGSQHVRFLSTTDTLAYTNEEAAGSERVLFVVEPYAIAVHLAKTYEWRCDRVVGFTKAEAVYRDSKRAAELEQQLVEERLVRHSLALEIDALRRVGLDLKGYLHNGKDNLDATLRDMDPTRKDGALGRLIAAREGMALALIELLQSDIWALLDEDARLAANLRPKDYGYHLDVSCYCMSRLAESKAGAKFLERLYVCFPPSAAGARAVPKNAAERIADEFLFPDEAYPQPAWYKDAVAQVLPNLLSLHAQAANVMAAAALARLDGWAFLQPGGSLQEWAKGPLKTQMGLTAYRWAYYLRNAYALEHVVLEGREQTVVWFERGKQARAAVLDLHVDWKTGEWQGRFGKSFDLEKVARLFSVVNFAFALGSLEEALVNKRKENVALLRTGSAALSLMDDRWVIGLMTRLDEVGKSGSGVAVARWMGALGALLGVYASFEDARYAWTEDGEGDVALVHGLTAVGGAVALWGSVAAASSVTGPPGWLVIGGFTLLLAGPLLAAALQDSELEKVVNHSVFGKMSGEDHEAPKFALCEGDRFSAWASTGVATLRAQHRALSNVTWAFGVQGQRMLGVFPLVRLLPQRLLSTSAFHVQVELAWGSTSNPSQVSLKSTVWLHVGDKHRLRMEHESGALLELVGVPVDGVRWATLSRTLSTVEGRRRQAFDVLFAPASPDMRERAARLELMRARVSVRLSAFGAKNDELIVPVPPPDAQRAALAYQLVEPNPNATNQGAEGQGNQVEVALFNTREVLSLTAYR